MTIKTDCTRCKHSEIRHEETVIGTKGETPTTSRSLLVVKETTNYYCERITPEWIQSVKAGCCPYFKKAWIK